MVGQWLSAEGHIRTISFGVKGGGVWASRKKTALNAEDQAGHTAIVIK